MCYYQRWQALKDDFFCDLRHYARVEFKHTGLGPLEQNIKEFIPLVPGLGG